jgi:hypothetical protein
MRTDDGELRSVAAAMAVLLIALLMIAALIGL